MIFYHNYGVKLSKEKNFANFTVLFLSAKVISANVFTAW